MNRLALLLFTFLAGCGDSTEQVLAACRLDAMKATVGVKSAYDQMVTVNEMSHQCMVSKGYSLKPRTDHCGSAMPVFQMSECYKRGLPWD